MGHTVFVLVLSMVLGGQQTNMRAISTHWSMEKCQQAAKEHSERIGPDRPQGTQLGCLVVQGNISY